MHDVWGLFETVGATVGIAWGLPILLWTVMVLPLYGVVRYMPVSHAAKHNSVRALLLSLPLGVLVAMLVEMPRAMLPMSLALPIELALAVVGTEAEESVDVIAWSLVWVGLGGLMACLAALVAGGRLLAEVVRLGRFRRTLRVSSDPHLQAVMGELQQLFHLKTPVVAQYHDALAVPITYGWRKPYILLPRALEGDREATRMALAHELAHVVRQDYMWQSGLQVIRALFVFHPLVHLLQRTLDMSRELACDALVFERCVFSRKAYARLLYTLTPVQPLAPLLAHPMLRSSNQLKNRLVAMKTTYPASRLYHRFIPALLLVLCVSAMACSDVISQDAASEPEVTTTAAKTTSEVTLTLRLENVVRSSSEVSGRVVDAQTGKTLPGVNVLVKDGDKAMGAATNLNGEFVIRNVNAAYKTIEAQFVGAKDVKMIIPE